MKPSFNEFYFLLKETQHDRELLPMEFNGRDVDPYWNHWEMLTMLREVNCYRKLAGNPLASWSDIKHAEQQAAGHIDYTKKFALYAWELAVSNV